MFRVNDSPLLIQILPTINNEAELAPSQLKQKIASLEPLPLAAQQLIGIKPGQSLRGRVVTVARADERIVGITVILRAVFVWQEHAAPIGVTQRAFGAPTCELFQVSEPLTGRYTLGGGAARSLLPECKVQQGAHVFPFALRVPTGPPTAVLPSFEIASEGNVCGVYYSLTALVERPAAATSLLLPSETVKQHISPRRRHSVQSDMARSDAARSRVKSPRSALSASEQAPLPANASAPPSSEQQSFSFLLHADRTERDMIVCRGAVGALDDRASASVLLAWCNGVRLATPPADWQETSTIARKNQFFSRKKHMIQMTINRKVFSRGQPIDVHISK